MKSGNNLNKALKEALNGHPEPLKDSQWERIRLELGESKKRPFRWILFPIAFILILLGGLTWYLIPQGQEHSAGNSLTPQSQGPSHDYKQSNKMEIDSKGKSEESTIILSDNARNQDNSVITNRPNSKNSNNRFQEPFQDDIKLKMMAKQVGRGGMTNNNINHKQYDDPDPDEFDIRRHAFRNEVLSKISDSNASDNEKKTTDLSEPNTILEKEKLDSNVKDENKMVQNTDDVSDNDSDEKKKGKKKNKNKGNNYESGKFVLGFASGFSWVNTAVKGLTNTEYMHKDTRKVFEATNDKQQSFNINLSVDYKLGQSNFSVNSGLQYRYIRNNIDYNYKITELPWRNSDNTIAFYITVPDSSSQEIRLRSNQNYSFLSMPFQLSYAIPFKDKWEFLFNAGVNVSTLIWSNGQLIDLDYVEVKEAKGSIKQKISLGYTGGIGISRQLYGQWYLGLECGISTINLKYNLGYGDLKSRIMAQNFNLQLRYKL